MIMQWYSPYHRLAYHNKVCASANGFASRLPALYMVDESEKESHHSIIKRLLLIPLDPAGNSAD